MLNAAPRNIARHTYGYTGRYARRPPIAQHRFEHIDRHEIRFLTKDTRTKQRVITRYTTADFLAALADHVPDRYRHNIRYFGLLSPRSKGRTHDTVFALLGQERRGKPWRLSWAALIKKSFGVDPLLDGQATKSRLDKIRAARMPKAEEAFERNKARRIQRAEKTWNDSPVSKQRFCYELEQVLDEDATVVCETGDRTPQEWLNVGPGRKSLIGPQVGFALGWCVGASIGVKIARPGNQVVALVGDGAFLFGQIESLWTASRYDVPIIFVVFDNRSYDGERGRLYMFSKMEGKKDNWKDMSCYLGNPDVDYVSIAKGFDIDGAKITTPDEIQPALKRACATTREGRPFMLDVVMARTGPAAESTWHPDISIAARRPRKV